MDRLEELRRWSRRCHPQLHAKLGPPPQAAKPANPRPRPPKPPPKPVKKNKKISVDPTDFLALRSELIEMKARLDESEQARALVEARLELARRRGFGVRDRAQRHQRSRQHGHPAPAQVAERASADSARLARRPNDGATTSCPPRSTHCRIGSSACRITPRRSPSSKRQIAELRSELEVATAAAAEAAALPPPPPALDGPDPETLERIAAVQLRVNDLDQIRHRLGEIDHFKQRMGEIDAAARTRRRCRSAARAIR